MKADSIVLQIEDGKHVFLSLVRDCSRALGMGEPIVNWAMEYDRSATNYVAFLFFQSRTERLKFDGNDLAGLSRNPALQQQVNAKILQALETKPH